MFCYNIRIIIHEKTIEKGVVDVKRSERNAYSHTYNCAPSFLYRSWVGSAWPSEFLMSSFALAVGVYFTFLERMSITLPLKKGS